MHYNELKISLFQCPSDYLYLSTFSEIDVGLRRKKMPLLTKASYPLVNCNKVVFPTFTICYDMVAASMIKIYESDADNVVKNIKHFG